MPLRSYETKILQKEDGDLLSSQRSMFPLKLRLCLYTDDARPRYDPSCAHPSATVR
jgi:hypothetical protein